MEFWRDVEGFEGIYIINYLGTIINVKRNIIMKFDYDKAGYKKIRLSKDGKRQNFRIHRLVAIAFVPNPLNKPCINHIDGNKKNNYYKNLEWCTYSENSIHAVEIGLKKTRRVYFKQLDMEFKSIKKCAKFLIKNELVPTKKVENVTCGISVVCRGRVKSYYGLVFEYLEEGKDEKGL